MANIGTAYIRIAPNMTGIQGKIAKGMKGAGGQATAQLGSEVNANSGPFQKAIGKLGGIAKVGGLAIAGGIAAGVAGLGALTGKALMAGAELEQQLGGAEAVFGEYADSIKEKAKDAYFQAGLSQNEFLQGANKMGSLFQGAGFSVQESMDMSSASMQRASDIASIMGIDTTAALEAVTGMAKGNFTMMDNLGVAMNDTSLNAYALEIGLGKTTAQMSIQEKVGLANQLFLQKTAKYAGNYAKENQTLSGSLNSTKKAFDNLLTGNGDMEGFMELLINTIELAVPRIVDILPKIVTGIGAILTGLVPALSAALPVLLPALINAVVGLLTSLVAAFPTIVKVLVEALPALIGAFVQIFIALVKALPEIITVLANAIPSIITAIVDGLTNPEALSAIIMGAVDMFLAIVKAIPTIIVALVDAIPTILENIVKTLTSTEFINTMIQASIELFLAIVKAIPRILGSIAGAIGKIIGVIANVLSPSNLMRIGGDMIKGLWQGIKDLGGWIIGKVKDFGGGILDGIKGFFGINSPSKVFAEIGHNLDRGLAKGIEGSAGLVTKSVDRMSNDALSAMVDPNMNASVAFSSTGALRSGINGLGGTNQSVTIGTVALGDSSAVQEFFKQLNQDTMNVGMGLTPIQGAQ